MRLTKRTNFGKAGMSPPKRPRVGGRNPDLFSRLWIAWLTLAMTPAFSMIRAANPFSFD